MKLTRLITLEELRGCINLALGTGASASVLASTVGGPVTRRRAIHRRNHDLRSHLRVSSRRKPERAGQAVAVIGGSAGIGLGAARRARAEGADVILTGRNPGRLPHAAAKIGARQAGPSTRTTRLRSTGSWLLGRSSASKDAELLVLWQEVAVLRRLPWRTSVQLADGGARVALRVAGAIGWRPLRTRRPLARNQGLSRGRTGLASKPSGPYASREQRREGRSPHQLHALCTAPAYARVAVLSKTRAPGRGGAGGTVWPRHADVFLRGAKRHERMSSACGVTSAGAAMAFQKSSNSLTRRLGGEQMTTHTQSLYDRLGGLDVINALTESWVACVGGDDRANGKFVRTDIPRLKKEVADQLCEATGGPCTYTGRSMRDTHAGMKTTAGEFDVVMQHLGAALDHLNVPKTEQDELVDLLSPMRDDIVEVESPQTGTPLPDSYRAAPPLT